MMQSNHSRTSGESGFTIIELIIAFTILLVGMTGIITMFSAGLSLDREGTLRADTARILDELQPLVHKRLYQQLQEGGDGGLSLVREPVPDFPQLTYDVHCVPMPNDEQGRGFLVTITLYSPAEPEEKTFSYGPLPMMLEPNPEEMVQNALEEKLR